MCVSSFFPTEMLISRDFEVLIIFIININSILYITFTTHVLKTFQDVFGIKLKNINLTKACSINATTLIKQNQQYEQFIKIHPYVKAIFTDGESRSVTNAMHASSEIFLSWSCNDAFGLHVRFRRI